MFTTEAFDCLEPVALHGNTTSAEKLSISTAISLKRIADALERPAGDPVQEMADVVAQTGGTMILDVYTSPEGHQKAHAVATWEDADESNAT